MLVRHPGAALVPAVCAGLVLAASSAAAGRPPNVVLVLCDNLGYGDSQVTNPAARQPTPELRRLAGEGTAFSHAYCAATVCTPSRAALQTGCYPRRVGLDRVPQAGSDGHVLFPVSSYGLHPDEITLAERALGGSSDPLPGEACSVAEGGMRVPLLARWPGHVPAGRTCDAVVSLIDVLPTLAALAGVSPPADRVIDGRDIGGLLAGRPAAVGPHEVIMYWHVDDLQAVRSGPWKLYRGGDRLVGFGQRREPRAAAVYNLVDDPAEIRKRISEHPEIATRLEDHARRMIDELGEGARRGPGCRSVGCVKNPAARKLRSREALTTEPASTPPAPSGAAGPGVPLR